MASNEDRVHDDASDDAPSDEPVDALGEKGPLISLIGACIVAFSVIYGLTAGSAAPSMLFVGVLGGGVVFGLGTALSLPIRRGPAELRAMYFIAGGFALLLLLFGATLSRTELGVILWFGLLFGGAILTGIGASHLKWASGA